MSAGGGDLQTSEESVVRETMGRERRSRLLLCSCLCDCVCVSLWNGFYRDKSGILRGRILEFANSNAPLPCGRCESHTDRTFGSLTTTSIITA